MSFPDRPSFAPPRASAPRLPGAGVTAVLGPTNTGKTHLAIERMLAHSSGLIGLPLRLLAREVYNKIAERAGAGAVALVTGEEKIKPPHARYWVSTIEAMPRDLDVAFLAIDEVQIAADLERGHVFTDRILNRRGRDETLLLGALTMRPIIERLLPGVNVVTRPRMSQLSFAGERKITRQPRRTAIVAFSAEEVYAIAELIRRQHGGAAVVLGALSPRTRNAQVALYQSGDVDYLVATDAIGMGLNLDVDHVAFAADRKYDGYQFRRLNPSEFSQIAGRAGRAARDGTFGTTGRCDPFEPELVNALQNHSFDSVKQVQWRNSDLDFASLAALQASLAMAPRHEGLVRAPLGEDQRVLDHAARDPHLRDLAHGRADVEKLWEVCQLPDYRRVAPAAHAELVGAIYDFLMRKGRIPDDWFAAQVEQANRLDGGIDTLSARIAHIRTWTFAANRADWLKDPDSWQETTRQVEDRLSDALHERLTERFVDRRTSVLMRRLRENTMLETEIGKTGDVVVEGHAIGRLDGFTFTPDASQGGSEAKALAAAAQKALAGEIEQRAERLSQSPDDQFVLASDNVIRWVGEAVGRIMASDDMLRPRVRILADEYLTGAPRDNVQARLDLWLKTRIEKILAPLFDLAKAEDVTGIARGIAFQLGEALGVIERQKVAAELKDLDQAARATLRKYGVRFGAYHVYVPALLKPAPRALAAQLWALKQDDVDAAALSSAEHLAASGRTSFPVDAALNAEVYRLLGYKPCGARAVRVDILERLADLIRPALAWRPQSPGVRPDGAIDGYGFTVTLAMTSLVGSAGEDFAEILRALGYRMEKRPKAKVLPPVAEVQEGAPEGASDATHDAAQADDAAQANEAAPVDGPVSDDAAEAPAADEPQPASVEASASDGPADAPSHEAPSADAPASEAARAEPATAENAAIESAEPEMVEVWRPGGRSDERRPRPQRHAQRHHGDAQAAEGEGAAAHRRHRGGHHARRDDAGEDGEGRQKSFRKPHRGSHEGEKGARFGGKGERHHERHADRHGGPRKDGGRKFDSRKDFAAPRNEPRERPLDPNSPFAKLAALKAQMENGGQ